MASLANSRNNIKYYVIIWLDSEINHVNKLTKSLSDRLGNLVNSIQIFLTLDQCIDYMKNITNEEIFLIITDTFSQQDTRLVHLIEETIEIKEVSFFCHNRTQERNYLHNCHKSKGIFTQMKTMCDALERTICPVRNTSSITSILSIVDSHPVELDQSYIYSKLLTELIYQLGYDDQAKKEAFNFCREYYADNQYQCNELDELERDYSNQSAIYWYTKETVINFLVRDALITSDMDRLIKMRFFIQDLHQAILKMSLEMNRRTKFIVYRGQRMLNDDFQTFFQRQGELYAFHNFISTSTDQSLARYFAQKMSVDPGSVGIVFQMEIDPSICSIPYIAVDNISYYLDRENEILFSTHTVFRIEDITPLEDRLWQVNLVLTNDIGQHLQLLTDDLQTKIRGINVWHSLALLLHQMGNYSQAMDFFKRTIERMDDKNEENYMTTFALMEHNIALMHELMGKYPSAIEWYQRVLESQEKSLPSDDPLLATIYNNMGMGYRSMGSYDQALFYCEKSLDIRLKVSSSTPAALITAYSNVGMVYESKGDYITALSHYKKSYEIQISSLPLHHLSLTLSYNNFGGIYCLIGKYSLALKYYEKTLEIQSKSLPLNHPSLVITYSNLGHACQLMEKYSDSLLYYDEAMQIQKKISSSNELLLATTYNNIALLHRLLGEHQKALLYYRKTLKIETKFLTPNHPSRASTYNNLGAMYQSAGNYSTAINYYKKAQTIWENTLPSNHPLLATIYNNIGSIHDDMKDYTQALVFYKKTIAIQETLPLSNPLELASTYNNIGEAYRAMKDYSTALSYYQKTLEIEEKYLPVKHSSLGITVSNMAVAFDENNQYEEAFGYAQRAREIFSHAFGTNHFHSINTRQFLDQLRQKLPLVASENNST